MCCDNNGKLLPDIIIYVYDDIVMVIYDKMISYNCLDMITASIALKIEIAGGTYKEYLNKADKNKM